MRIIRLDRGPGHIEVRDLDGPDPQVPGTLPPIRLALGPPEGRTLPSRYVGTVKWSIDGHLSNPNERWHLHFHDGQEMMTRRPTDYDEAAAILVEDYAGWLAKRAEGALQRQALAEGDRG